MQEFMRKFTQLNGNVAKIILNHCLFGKQEFYCDSLQTINDDDRMGVLIKDYGVFMYKHDIKVAEICGHVCEISDGRLKISIICKKI